MSVGGSARMGGLFWLLTMVMGLFAMVVGGRFNAATDAGAAAASLLRNESSFRASLLPRAVGALMVSAGLAWLTLSLASLLSPPFARSLFPYIGIPGLLGEASLTLWLLMAGVNVQRWREQAASVGEHALRGTAR